jgi:hypothetical protein
VVGFARALQVKAEQKAENAKRQGKVLDNEVYPANANGIDY